MADIFVIKGIRKFNDEKALEKADALLQKMTLGNNSSYLSL